jgi:small subunit ribosomal protein S16
MATVIRLRREGSKNHPYYRIVVTDKRSPRDGKFLEILGHYAPRSKDKTLAVDLPRVEHWVALGAQPSVTVSSLIKRQRKANTAAAAASA